MENILTAMFLLILPAKNESRKLLDIVSAGCITSEVIYIGVDDSALYYSVITVLAATLSMKSVKIKCVAAKTYSALMLFQATLCATLIPSFSMAFNNLMQYELKFYNDWILTVILLFCVIGTDNLITKRFI